MTTRSPGAGDASSGTWLSPWFGPCWAGRCTGDHENDLIPERALPGVRPGAPSLAGFLGDFGEKDRLGRGSSPCLVCTALAFPPPLARLKLRPRTLSSPRRHAAQTLIDFDTLAAEAGAGEVVLKYLRARGLARTATLALVEPTEARFRATVIDPLVAGYVDAATNAEFKVAAGDQPSITAILLHMYLEARSQWDAWSAARAAALCPAAAPAAAAAAGQAPMILEKPT